MEPEGFVCVINLRWKRDYMNCRVNETQKNKRDPVEEQEEIICNTYTYHLMICNHNKNK